jgi:hypothetical protein
MSSYIPLSPDQIAKSDEFYKYLDDTNNNTNSKNWFINSGRPVHYTPDISGVFLPGKRANLDINTFYTNQVTVIPNFLDKSEVDLFTSLFPTLTWPPMRYNPTIDKQGNKSTIEQNDGGYAIRFYDVDFGKKLWAMLSTNLGELLNNKDYIAVGVNPYIRLHDQNDGNHIKPHYDCLYTFDNGFKTSRSVIIYFTDNKSGVLSFIDAESINDEVNKYVKTNYKGLYNRTDIYPEKGKIAIFDNDIIHTVTEIIGESRIALATEIIMRKRD